MECAGNSRFLEKSHFCSAYRWLSQITGVIYFDGIASIIIGLILGGTAIWLAYETKGLLIGESANTRIVEGIRALVRSSEGVDKIN